MYSMGQTQVASTAPAIHPADMAVKGFLLLLDMLQVIRGSCTVIRTTDHSGEDSSMQCNANVIIVVVIGVSLSFLFAFPCRQARDTIDNTTNVSNRSGIQGCVRDVDSCDDLQPIKRGVSFAASCRLVDTIQPAAHLLLLCCVVCVLF